MNHRPRPIPLIRRAVDLALVVLVGLVLVGVLLGRGLPLTGRQTLIIAGRSMEPMVPMGAAAVMEPYEQGGPAVGDVVAIRVGPTSALFTHRVIRTLSLNGEPYIETKGDANPDPDPATTPARAALGRVVWAVPYAGYLLALLSAPAGALFVLGLGMTLLVLAFLLETLEPRAVPGPEGAPVVSPPSVSVPLEGRVARHLASRPNRVRSHRSA